MYIYTQVSKNVDMKDDSNIFQLHADFCKVIAEPKRLKIIALLAEQEMSVSEIAAVLDTSSSNVSQHLRVLRARNVVQTRKDGQTVYYRLMDPRIPKVCAEIRSILLDGMNKRGEIARGMRLKK